MHIYLFDQILETHVCTSLEQSLLKLGHQITSTGTVWSGHKFPVNPADISKLHEAVDQAIASKPDVLFNFRASSLLPQHIARLRAAGIRTMVWQPDDPVLYGICYSHIMDHYDDVFLCAGHRVVDFYLSSGHKPAINLPFWVDTERYAYGYEQEKMGFAVFLGNGSGKAREGRYEALCALTDNISLYGRFQNDPRAKVRGRLSVDGIISTIPKYRIAVSVAQTFSTYAQTEYDFPGLDKLGQFFLPSRVIQYAALGMPIITIQPSDYDPMHYPPGLHARDFDEAKLMLAKVTESPERLNLLSTAARQYAVRNLSADSRARLINQVCSDAACERPQHA